MDPRTNPYSPTAGWPPPEFAGREGLIDDMDIAFARILKGRQANSVVLRGLRGVGKTVLLNHLQDRAAAQGFETVKFEVPDPQGGHLVTRALPQLSAILGRLSTRAKAEDLARKGLLALRSLAALFKVRYEGISVGIDPAAAPVATGRLDVDLIALLQLVAGAAQADGKGIALFVDEIQYLNADELSALSLSCHELGQKQLPFIVVGSGLPQISAKMADAKSYAERLFDFPELGPLDPAASRRVIAGPAREEGVSYSDAALDRIVAETRGYPYFLQTWGKFTWNVAERSPVTGEDVAAARNDIVAYLDTNFFRVRYDRCSDAEKHYLRGMAELGERPQKTGDIAAALGTTSQKVARLRAGLIEAGMIYSPQYGETAFTVPLFDAFMKRVMPDLEPYRAKRTRS